MQTRRTVLKRMLVAAPLLSAGGILFAVAGCGGGGDDDSPPSRTTRQRGTYGPLSFTLDMDRIDYAPDETIELTFTVQNTSRNRTELSTFPPTFECGIGYKNTTEEDPGYARFYIDVEGTGERAEDILLDPGQMLSSTIRVTADQLRDGFPDDYLARGGIRVMPWLSVSAIDGEFVPYAPLYDFPSTAEGTKPRIVSLVQEVSIR